MRDIEGPGRTGISCRGDSPIFSLQLCKLDWFNQSNFRARLKLTVVQEQLLDVSCRINVQYESQIPFAHSVIVAAVADRGRLANLLPPASYRSSPCCADQARESGLRS